MKDQSPKSFSAVSLTVLILVALLLFSSSSPLLASSVFQNFLAQLRILGTNNLPSNSVFVDKDNGNVGIGKTDPATELDVEGTITATKFKNANGEELGGSVWTVDDDNIYREEGAVGIGTSSPRGSFEVRQAADATLIVEDGDQANAIQLRFDDENDSAIRAQFEAWDYSFEDKDGESMLFINKDGNVGIGKTDPATELDVEGTITATKFKNADGEELGGSVWTKEEEAYVLRSDDDIKMSIGDNGNVSIGEWSNINPLLISNTSTMSSGAIENIDKLHLKIINNSTARVDRKAGIVFQQRTSASSRVAINSAIYTEKISADTVRMNLDVHDQTALTIDNTGKVGIGKTDPTTKLDVDGVVTATKFKNADGEELGGSFWTVDGNNIYREEGNVGIGTDNPSNKLQIAATSSDWPLLIRDDEKGVQLGFSRNSIRQRGADFNIEANEGDIVFKTNPTPGKSLSNLTERMKIAGGTGNVGIGEDNPGYKLDVVGDINTSGQYLVNGESIGGLWTEDASKKITYLTQTGHKLGIGTKNPTSRLTVDGNITLIGASGSRNIQIASGGNNLNIRNPNVDKDINLDISPTRGKLLIRSHNGTSVVNNLLIVQADGKVGIGVEDPGYNLDVNGDINLSGFYRKSGKAVPATGTYVGNNKTAAKGGKTIEVGFRPRMVQVFWDPGTYPNRYNQVRDDVQIHCLKTDNMPSTVGWCTWAGNGHTCRSTFELTNTGFKVSKGQDLWTGCHGNSGHPNRASGKYGAQANAQWYYIAWP